MIVNPAVVVDIKVSRLDFPDGQIVYIAASDNYYAAGSWRDIQNELSSYLMIHASTGLPVCDINFGS